MKTNPNTPQQLIPGINIKDITVSLKEPGTHVLDAIMIREALENHFKFDIPDEQWLRFNTLSEALGYCKVSVPARQVTTERKLEIRLPQMANSGLSENWLLKEIGDMHWEMLSQGLAQKTSAFADSMGNRLYAAFVRINYALTPLNYFKENEPLQLQGALERFGNHIYTSSIQAKSNNKHIRANMLSSFSLRKENDNTQFVPGKLVQHTNLVREQEFAPALYTEHRLLSKRKTDEINYGGYNFKVTDKEIASLVHTINPYFEINGAGLLYFASYPIVADTVASLFFRKHLGINNYNSTYHTSYRDIFYFANCNANDLVKVSLNSVEHIDEQTLKMTASLHRESDNKLMARVFTIKQKK